MITNDIIQAGIISKLKSISAIVALVGSEIRESSWQGTDFVYPSIRVDLQPTSPSIEGCNFSEIDFWISVYSEKASSLESSQIQAVIVENMPRSFSYVSGLNTYLFSGVIIPRNGLGSPFRMNERTWTNQITYQGIVSMG